MITLLLQIPINMMMIPIRIAQVIQVIQMIDLIHEDLVRSLLRPSLRKILIFGSFPVNKILMPYYLSFIILSFARRVLLTLPYLTISNT